MIYVGVLISLWLFLFPIFSTIKRIVLGWVKEVINVWSSGEYVNTFFSIP
jgi:hypothetical protein